MYFFKTKESIKASETNNTSILAYQTDFNYEKGN